MLLDSNGQRLGVLLNILRHDLGPNVIIAEVEKLRSKWILPSLGCGEGLGSPHSLSGSQDPQPLEA